MFCLGRQIAGSRKVVCEYWDVSEVIGAVMVGFRYPRAGGVGPMGRKLENGKER